MKFKKIIWMFVLLFSVISVCGLAQAKEEILIEKAWVKAMPPAVPNTAAYLEIHNKTNQDISLVSVESKDAKFAEIHEMSYVDDVMRMGVIEEPIKIPAGSKVEFTVGGKHIMLIDLVEPLEMGSTAEITFKFDNGVMLTVDAIVKSLGATDFPEKDHKGSHHHKGSMHH